jgi:sulfide dehydrogenase cytochrome subunit
VRQLEKLIYTTALAVLLSFAGPASADISGVLPLCTGCHGEDGLGTGASIPIIAGIPAVNQEDALYAYMDGDRQCGTSEMMCKAAARLTEDQIVELAAHYAAMPFQGAEEEFDAALAEAGKSIHMASCAICHGADEPGSMDASILHGQRMDYLRYALQQYAADARLQMPAMAAKIGALSDDDIEALVNYYASHRN